MEVSDKEKKIPAAAKTASTTVPPIVSSPIQTRTPSKSNLVTSSRSMSPTTSPHKSPSLSITSKSTTPTGIKNVATAAVSNTNSTTTSTNNAISKNNSTSQSSFAIPSLPEYPSASSAIESESSDSILLGIQELERQQLEKERRQASIQRENPFESPQITWGNRNTNTLHPLQKPQDLNHDVPSTVHLRQANDDDLTLESELQNKRHERKTSFGNLGKFLKTPLKPIRRNKSDTFNVDPTPSKLPSESKLQPIIYGYLHKLGRNNKWQKRWFEITGKELQYFKTKKKEKCLATLDLLRVGTIEMDPSDASGCTFTIEVAGRPYYLCADTKEKATDWCINLNRSKEARANLGGLHLIDLDAQPKRGSDSDEENAVARVVMNTTRPRTKGLGKEDFSSMEHSLESDENSRHRQQYNVDGQMMSQTMPLSPSFGTPSITSSSPRLMLSQQAKFKPVLTPQMHNEIVVRWKKQRSTVENWARRVSRWAKRMTMVRCVIKNEVIHMSEQQFQEHTRRALEANLQGESSSEDQIDDHEEPFIDFGVDYPEVVNKSPNNNFEAGSTQRGHATNAPYPVSGAGNISIQSSSGMQSSGRISPILSSVGDDGSRITFA